jgi:anionic cell wall polymer biosynthesis LytR-Cps2A-Psr (LCP) family protein
LEFARDRLNQPGGDNGRGQNQMKVIKALIAKVTNARTLIANYSQILSSMEGMIATDFTAEDISKLVKMQLSDMAQWNVLTYAVTGYHGNETTYSMPGLATYVMHPYQYTVNYGHELIQRVMNGELLTQEDMTVPR